jgi:predicted secreted protein
MGIGILIAVYFIVWWTILFAVLPWGVRTQEEEGEVTLGTVPSAPVRPRLVKKAIVTSIVSAVIVFLFWLAVDRFGLSVEGLADFFGGTPR